MIANRLQQFTVIVLPALYTASKYLHLIRMITNKYALSILQPYVLAKLALIAWLCCCCSIVRSQTADSVDSDDAALTSERESLKNLIRNQSTYPDIPLSQYKPTSRMIVPLTKKTSSKFPSVDVHTHMYFRTLFELGAIDRIVDEMDANNIAVTVSLDGTLGDRLNRHRKQLWKNHKDRFVIYANIDFRGVADENQPALWLCNQPNFVRHTCEQLKTAHSEGISGLKFFKQFGLGYKNADGSLVKIDDPQWDPIWDLCGELGLPVILHTGDPSAFFQPIDAQNERYDELRRHPDWSFTADTFPARDELHAARNRVVGRHPGTKFIFAHFGNDAEDLAQTSEWLDRYPNVYIETASRINELGRQPYTARDFFLKYQDRIMFGTDGPWPAERLSYYWQFFETKDEYFSYSEKDPPPQGLWSIYGIYLPDGVLNKIYHLNAEKIIPGVAERVTKYEQNLAATVSTADTQSASKASTAD